MSSLLMKSRKIKEPLFSKKVATQTCKNITIDKSETTINLSVGIILRQPLINPEPHSGIMSGTLKYINVTKREYINHITDSTVPVYKSFREKTRNPVY